MCVHVCVCVCVGVCVCVRVYMCVCLYLHAEESVCVGGVRVCEERDGVLIYYITIIIIVVKIQYPFSLESIMTGL